MRIAMIGTRGVPATFGGVEHHTEQIGSRLADMGHDVTVFCRTNYVEEAVDTHRGMKLVHLPTVGTKHLDAIVHSGLSTVSALRDDFDVIHYHALGPGAVAPIPRFLSGTKVVQTIHGLDDERAKWGKISKAMLRTAGWMSARVPQATIVVSKALKEHYTRRHHRTAHYIPNGMTAPTFTAAKEITEKFGLNGGDYFLYVGRLVPEKAPDLLMKAFQRVPGDIKLVVAGGTSFTNEYTERLQQLAAEDPRIIMPGYVFGSTLHELYTNAAAFVLPSFLEGLPLTLLEAASYHLPLVASSIAPHLEVLGEAGPGRRVFLPGDEEALMYALRVTLRNLDHDRAAAEVFAKDVAKRYCWDQAAEDTERVYLRALAGPPRFRKQQRPALAAA
jgi:glycosyltransferase involved in cell wall biosynthesis